MIQVIIYKREAKIIGYSASGHAEYADRGEDVICAAVSVLTISTENAIDALTDDKFVAEMDDDGYVKVMMTEEVSHDTTVLLSAFEIAVNSISEAYGRDYIQIRIEEV